MPYRGDASVPHVHCMSIAQCVAWCGEALAVGRSTANALRQCPRRAACAMKQRRVMFDHVWNLAESSFRGATMRSEALHTCRSDGSV